MDRNKEQLLIVLAVKYLIYLDVDLGIGPSLSLIAGMLFIVDYDENQCLLSF